MLIWSDNAVANITEFINHSANRQKAQDYMAKLVDYVDHLRKMKKLGKDFEYSIFDYELRQLIYKNHRILYSIKENDIIIFAILHSKMDIEKALKRLKRDFDR